MTHMCRMTDCTKDGVEVVPGLVLCRHHRKVIYHRLCELYHTEQEAKLKNAEARKIAHQEAGWTRPPEPMLTGRGEEISGGQFESNRRKH